MEKKKIESQKLVPCLWFNKNAAEAVKFYTSVFKNSAIGKSAHYGKNAPLPEGTVLTVPFELEGQNFLALNGGPDFQFSEAISFVVNCDTQQEIDDFWSKLLAGGGEEQQCGWLKDRFGLSWQVVPAALSEWLQGDAEGANRVMNVLMKMVKLDVNKLKQAYESVTA
jgi:predicted 3-demethylubiquinone-9 3-methyltransferase (glyoxalase superfamily)